MTTKDHPLTVPIRIAVLFITTRIFYLLLLNPYHYSVLAPEERYIGTIAQEILQGLSFSLFDYQANSYLGGSLAIGILVVPFFKWLGTSLFVLKLVPLLISAITLILWYLMIQQYFGKLIAMIFAFLYVFSPPSFTHYSVTALGSHAESSIFTIATIYLYFLILSKKKTKWFHFGLLGLLAGFGFWFSYIYAVTAATMLIFWIWLIISLRPKYKHRVTIHSLWRVGATGIRFKQWLILILFCLIGLIPWIVFNLRSTFTGMMIYDIPFWEYFHFKSLLQSFSDYRHWAGYHLFLSFGMPVWGMPLWLNVGSGFAYLALYSIPAILCFAPYKEKIESDHAISFLPTTRFFALYALIFTLCVQFSDFTSLRYFMPLYPVLFLFVAIGIRRAYEIIPYFKRDVIPGFLALTILVGTFTHLFLFSPFYLGKIVKTKGYAYQLLENTICKNPQPCFEKYSEFQSKLEPLDLHQFSSDIAQHAAEQVDSSNLLRETEALQPYIHSDLAYYFYFFLGRYLAEEFDQLPNHIKTIPYYERDDPENYKHLVMGILSNASYLTPKDFERIFRPYAKSELAFVQECYWNAWGKLIARTWFEKSYSLNALKDAIQLEMTHIEPQHQPYFLQGVGRYLYDKWSSRPLKPYFKPKNILRFPHQWQPDILKGIGIEWAERDLDWRIANPHWYWREFTKDYTLQHQEYVRKGYQKLNSHLTELEINFLL